MKTKKESAIESAIVKYAKGRNFIAYKLCSPYNKGMPDRMFITPNGCIFFIEFKAEHGKLSKLQDYCICDLKTRNCDVFVVNNIELGKAIIDDFAD